MASQHLKSKNENFSSASPSQSFQFINFTNVPHVDEYDRYIIRSRAISDYHHRKRTKDPSSAVKASQGVQGSNGKFRLRRQGLEEYKRSMPTEQIQQPMAEFSIPDINRSLPILGQSILQGDSTRVLATESEFTLRPDAAEISHKRTASLAGSSRRAREVAAEDLINNTDLLAVNLNPLLNLPIESSDRMRLWIHHYFNDRSLASLLMVNVRKSWLRTSLQDPAFFTAVSSHYAGRYSLSSRQGDPMESLLLRMEAIKIVNKRIAQADDHVSDGTIGAVASLVTYESNNGTLEAIRTHMAGLNQMIDLRGGFQKAGFPPSLQRIIGWAELTAVNILDDPPSTLSLTTTGLDLPSYCTTRANELIAQTLQCPNHTIDFFVLSTSMPEIFADLRYLSSVLESKNQFSVAHMDSMWYSDKVYLVQRNLVYSSLDPEQEPLHTACYIAGSMYVNSYLRDLGFHSGVIALLVTKLKNFLEKKVLEAVDGYDGGLVMDVWILFVGGISAMGKPERGWFVERLRIVCKALKVETASQAQAALRKIVWSRDWNDALEEMWQELSECISSQ